MKLQDRFIKYVKFDTQSAENSDTFPSTLKQHLLGEELVKELKELGIENAFKDNFGYVYGYLKGNKEKTIGLIAHLDTALEVSGANVNPQVIENYNGEDIILNENFSINIKDFPFIKNFKGDTLITTDGTTLLGADDKAGVAIIMSLVSELINTNGNHPSIWVVFTPDEEVGNGALHFNYDLVKVDFAYTIDGAAINSISYENFNAASAYIKINGVSIHPGDSKGKMINSIMVAKEFDNMLPVNARPEYTAKYDGFNHLLDIKGSVSLTEMAYIIRNHDNNLFEQQKDCFRKIAKYLNEKYGENTVELYLQDSYKNMKDLILPHPEVIELPKKAIAACGYTPESEPIRGGTDGARLTYEGVLCPNLGTGSYNHHGPKEFANVNEMEMMVKILKTMLIELM